MFKRANRLSAVKPSPTLTLASKVSELKAEGRPIIDLGLGEPDFETPDSIKAAGIQAIHQGQTKYTAVAGTLALRSAIQTKLKRDNQLHYQTDEILVTCGGKQAFYNLAQVLLNPDDEAILPAPYWVSYPDMLALAEAKTIIVPTAFENRFKLTPEQLDAAITPKTKLLIINSPSNPTGIAYTRAELEALGEVLQRHPQVFIASDDMYERIFWGKEPFCNLAQACPNLRERIIIVHGVSKSYAMTGWRIGYAAGPKEVIKAMTIIQSQSTSNACSIAQAAAQQALSGDQNCTKRMYEAFKQRHDYFIPALDQLDGVSCHPTDGAFYAFPEIKGLIQKTQCHNDLELSLWLLEHQNIACIPGSAFGAPNHLRFSFATNLDNLHEAIERLASIR